MAHFSISWRKGVKGFLNSEIDFDYLEYGISQKLKMGWPVRRITVYQWQIFSRKKICGWWIINSCGRVIRYFFNPHKILPGTGFILPIFNRFYEGITCTSFMELFSIKFRCWKSWNCWKWPVAAYCMRGKRLNNTPKAFWHRKNSPFLEGAIQNRWLHGGQRGQPV